MGGLSLDWGVAVQSLPFLLKGIKLTIIITLGGLLFGFFIGVIAGVARTAKNKLIFSIATAYVEVIRGTPILVQVLFIYFGLNQILQQTVQWKIDPITAGIAAIAINSGAYIAEIVRGSIQSIEKGQVEAGRSLGLTRFQTFYHIVWPQAFKRMIPPLGNQFIISLKDTSLFAVIGVGELTRQGQISVSTTFAAFEIYTFVALLYFVLNVTISLILRMIERRLDVG